jgi:hypothetical protein
VLDAQYHHLTPAPPPVIVYVKRPHRIRFPQPLRRLGNLPGKLLKPLRRRFRSATAPPVDTGR